MLCFKPKLNKGYLFFSTIQIINKKCEQLIIKIIILTSYVLFYGRYSNYKLTYYFSVLTTLNFLEINLW